MAFTSPAFTTLTNAQRHFMEIYIEFYPNRSQIYIEFYPSRSQTHLQPEVK